MDALTHAIESYIGTLSTDESDFYGLAATRLIFANLPEACRNGGNLQARQAMALASSSVQPSRQHSSRPFGVPWRRWTMSCCSWPLRAV